LIKKKKKKAGVKPAFLRCIKQDFSELFYGI
jgi:hypothetical protein